MEVAQRLIDRVLEAELELASAKTELSRAIIEASPFEINDVLRDKNTGALYRIASGSSGYLSSGRPRLFLRCYRTYKTGRREARSSTLLDWPSSHLELYKEN